MAILGTHPEYRNRGVTTKLIKWELEFADEHEKAIAVVGSSMGSKIYKSLDFKFVGAVLIHIDGEEEKMNIGDDL